MLSMEVKVNASLTRLMEILTPDMRQIIVNPTPPPGGKKLTDEVVDKPLDFQSVRRWANGKPMELTHMGQWDRVAAPGQSIGLNSKGGRVDVRV